MNTSATECPPATHRGRRQFNLRTLFEITTGVCIVAPAVHDFVRATPLGMFQLGLCTLLVGVSQFEACRLFVKGCPLTTSGKFSAIAFCMGAFAGFLVGVVLGLAPIIRESEPPLTLVVAQSFVAVIASVSATSMISLVLYIPARFAALLLSARTSPLPPSIQGLAFGALTGVFFGGIAWLFFSVQMTSPAKFAILFVVWTTFGGYLGGRLFESRQASQNGVMQNGVRTL